jgi:hypothetical protein
MKEPVARFCNLLLLHPVGESRGGVTSNDHIQYLSKWHGSSQDCIINIKDQSPVIVMALKLAMVLDASFTAMIYILSVEIGMAWLSIE